MKSGSPGMFMRKSRLLSREFGKIGVMRRCLLCAIVTCPATKKMSVIHARMPVILRQESWRHWMGETDQKAASLMTAVCDDFLQYYSVNTAVNSNKATGAGLILPMKAHLYS